MIANRVYLDWNATAPLRPEARAAMTAVMETCGNPSSVHAEGRQARHIVQSARRTIAEAVGAEPADVVFTSGGTEANALALHAAEPGRLLVSAIEHPSVLARAGRGDPIPVTSDGIVDLDRLGRRLAAERPELVSIMLANNETGAIQPIADIARLVQEHGGLLHVDAVQAFGKIPLSISALGVDLLTLSAHKIGGPQGVGALVVGPRGRPVVPLLTGGGQESGLRAGTENVPGIAGFAAAASSAISQIANMANIGALRATLEAGLRQTPGVVIFAANAPRLPTTTLFTAPGLRAETAVIQFDLAGIAVSSGSACSSGKVQPSHVLRAMGFPADAANGAIRLSLGWDTTASDIDRCLKAWRSLAGALFRRDETVLERF